MYKPMSGGRGGMSFILAQTLVYQLNMLEGSLQGRINHIALLFSEVKAITDGKTDIKISNEDSLKLEEVSKNIETLRDSYEPFLDNSEAKEVTDNKRKIAEKLIDMSRYNILYIIEKYSLVDMRTLQEVAGLTWND
jgi:hypothetical protein